MPSERLNPKILFGRNLGGRGPVARVVGVAAAVLLASPVLTPAMAASITEAAGWGSNGNGRLGNNSVTDSTVAVAVSTAGALAGKTLRQVSAGSAQSCGVATDGTAYCWGQNANGRLGDNTTTTSRVPVAVLASGALAGKQVVQISTGAVSTCAATMDGALLCWGGNDAGQLGVGAAVSQENAPVAVSALAAEKITQVSVGLSTTSDSHVCAVTSSGAAWCWGYNFYGQLGDNTTTTAATPVAVTGALSSKKVAQISASTNHSCAVTEDGAAYCWGRNLNGQLGNGNQTDAATPQAVTTAGALSGKTVVQIAAGSSYTCALTSEGKVYCWGTNLNGQLGVNSKSQQITPQPVDTTGALAGKFVTQISAGISHTCAVTSEGRAYCWGAGGSGRLGNGGTAESLVPAAVDVADVLANSFVSQIDGGSSHTVAVAPAGGPGRTVAGGSTALWQQMALPCAPAGSATVAGVFGDGAPMDLTTADYNVPNPAGNQGWVVWRQNAAANQYVRLSAADAVALKTGYWFRSYQPSRQGRFMVSCPATTPDAPVTQGQGCASANGCVAITLTSVSGVDRQNLVGNPFPYAIDWSQVRVRIDGSTSTYTPSQAARLAGSGNAPFAAISNTFNVWNGTSYSAYSDSGVTAGQLPYFSSFWVKVLSGSFGHTVELLIPNLPTQTASPF